jgi:hypothetical protein
MIYDIFYVSKNKINETDWLSFNNRFPSSQKIENVQSFTDISKKSFTKLFWVVWNDLIVLPNFNFSYVVPKWDEQYIHVFKNGSHFDGICLFSKQHQVSEKEFKHQQGHQVGGFAFGFEEGQAFLNQLMIYDHQGRKYEELVSFPKTISELTPESLSQISLEALAWDKLTIVVVGDKSLEKSLSRIRPVRILNYEDFL